jgi:hypothetical protein
MDNEANANCDCADWNSSDISGSWNICLLQRYGTQLRRNLTPLINLPSPDTQPNKIAQLDMKIKFDENAGNDFQGDTFNLTMIFTLHQ